MIVPASKSTDTDIATLPVGAHHVMMIGGQTIEVSREDLPQSRLRFYEANPRIFSIVRRGSRTASQSELQSALLAMEHVKVLIQDIQRNGGLIEPIYVKRGTNEVIEGNSRLAAYRALAEKDPVKWGKIPSIVLPEGFPDALTFGLLAQLHVRGKKDWAKYEQAGFLQRRFHGQGVDIPTLVNETGLTQREIKHLIDTYDFMTSVKDDDVTHWSHYDEFRKSRKMRNACDSYPTLEDVVVRLIKTDTSFRAVDVRDRLPIICQGPKRVLKRFSEGTLPFEDAYEKAVEGGADNSALRRLTKLRHWLADPETVRLLTNATDADLDKMAFELDKLKTRTNQVHAMVDREIKKRR
jgi:hypothetical protein